jgi:hypothetical protein
MVFEQIKSVISDSIHLNTNILNIDDVKFIIGSTNNSDNTNIYLVLDTHEGKNCVGHWLWECVVYTIFFNKLKGSYPNLKILCHGYKRYKEHFCNNAGISSKDICYDSIINPYRPNFHNSCFINEIYTPVEEEYTIIVPEYKYLGFLSSYNKYYPNSHFNLEFRKLFRLYKDTLPLRKNIEKDLDCIYMIRSRDLSENYSRNRRNFINMDDVTELMNKKKIPIYDVIDFDSIAEQIKIVERAKTIVVEHGSGWWINGVLFAKNTHIIVLQKIPIGCLELEDELCKENNNTYEFIENTLNDWTKFNIPIDKLEVALKKRGL